MFLILKQLLYIRKSTIRFFRVVVAITKYLYIVE